MKGKTQRETNPYPFSDSNKRYLTLDYYMRHRFGKKCAKIPLDAGFTCPNIDGTKGVGGCIYCLGGSAAVTAVGESIREQYERGVAAVRGKWGDFYTVPYLQSNTCTYGDPERLRVLYRECARLPDAVMLAIATRADCLSAEVIRVIVEISEEIPVLVEIGLQTSSDSTAERINRCHKTADFLDGYNRLKAAGGDISVCVHLINGLPGEGREDMIRSAEFAAALHPDMVKLHLMHVLYGTSLCEMYEAGDYIPMDRDDYISVVCDQIERMPTDTVMARITGDGFGEDLAAPDWSRRKKSVINDIDKELFRRGTFQGIFSRNE